MLVIDIEFGGVGEWPCCFVEENGFPLCLFLHLGDKINIRIAQLLLFDGEKN